MSIHGPLCHLFSTYTISLSNKLINYTQITIWFSVQQQLQVDWTREATVRWSEITCFWLGKKSLKNISFFLTFTTPSVYFVTTTRYTKMNTATNIYIFNLALADALATSTLPFQSAKYLMNTWPFGDVLCKLIIAIDYYNMFTSIFTLTMMSVDRYIAVCHPVRALEFRTPVKAKLINILIWVLSSAIGVPVMIMAVTKVADNGKTASACSLPLGNILRWFLN